MVQYQDRLRFENLVVWQKAQKLGRLIYEISSTGSLAKDFALKNQMRRAVISIFSNIAEGQGRFSTKEYLHYLSIANGSTYELISQVHFARELGFIEDQESSNIVGLCNEVSLMIKALRKSRAETL
jgi:four helix bundle protein